MPKLFLRPEDRTNPIIWLIAIICAILAIAVTLTGLLVIIIYLIYQPKMPYLIVTSATLNKFDYDQSGLLDIIMALSIEARNENHKAHATFSNLRIYLKFHEIEMAELRAQDFEVEKNGSKVLNYLVGSTAVPLDERERTEMNVSLTEDLVRFGLVGQVRTAWKVGSVLDVRLWTHLDCLLQFFRYNKTSYMLDCNSKSHAL